MKKTKIIVPAIAALVLSAGASVSGTLAWFSADRSATSAVNNIAVINPEGDLKLTTATKCNTTCSGTDVSLESGYSLRDASVQVAAGSAFKVWGATNVDENGDAEGYKEIATSPYVYSSTKKIVYCAAWTMSFSIDGANNEDEFNFIFEISSSSYTVTTGEEINVAYRLAIYTDSVVAIWAPNSSESSLKYIKDGAVATYTKNDEDVTLGSGKSLSATAVIWFEGEDDNCSTDNLSKDGKATGSASLVFSAEKK